MNNFAWAIEELKAGRKVRREMWPQSGYVFVDISGQFAYSVIYG